MGSTMNERERPDDFGEMPAEKAYRAQEKLDGQKE